VPTTTGQPQVHLLAGLNGAGKTTLARHLQARLPAVRFTLDEWMLRLHGLSFDHPRYPGLVSGCQELVWDTALQVLAGGGPVVLDWNQWSRQRRRIWRDKAVAAGYQPVLHHITAPLAVAITRAEARGSPFCHVLDPAGIAHLERIFEPPSADEGLMICAHDE